MKCSLGVSHFLEEVSSLFHSIVFLYFFALITEECLLISPYSSELCIQMGVSFLFSCAFQYQYQFSRSVLSDSATPWTATRQASLSITNSWSLFKLMSIKSVMPCNHLILGWPLLLPFSIFPSIRVFSNESALHIRWPKYWSFSFSISSSNEYSGLISFSMD